MANRVKEIDLGWEEFRRRVLEFDGDRLEVGIFNDEGEDNEREIIAAAVNEFGSDTIPERPAWRDTLTKNSDTYWRILMEGASLHHAGKLTKGKLWDQLGERVVKDIQDAINSFSDPANADSTVRSKKRNDPLVDTGSTRDAIKHRVVKA